MKSVRLILLVALLFATVPSFAQRAAKGKPQSDAPATDTQQAAGDTKLRQPTKEEVQELTTGLERSLSQPTDLPVVSLGNGIYKIDLDGTHEDVMLAKKNPDGTVSTGCVATKREAEEFLTGSGQRARSAKKSMVKKNASKSAAPATSAGVWEEK